MNLTNCTAVSFPADAVSSSAPGKAVLTLTLSLLTLMATAMNSLVITAIIVTKKLHHPANYLICSLAVTDLLVAVLVMPFSIIYIVMETWIMGQVVCTIWLSVDITCCTCSILHLAAIALDRYRAVTDAVEYSRHRTFRRAAVMIVAVWVISILISIPPIVWRHHRFNGTEECIIEHDHIAFTIYCTFGAFYIPLCLILILYYKIYRAAKKLYHRRIAKQLRNQRGSTSMLATCSNIDLQTPNTLSPTEKSYSEPSTEADRVRITPQSPKVKSFKGRRFSVTRERKAATMLGLILGAFIICWLPFFLKEVIVNTCCTCSTSTEVANFLAWLGYLNSLINPLIYTVFNEDFKKAFQKLCECRHCVCWKETK
ncbi:5-hydroxytryptamine receptor 1F-like [Scleropages formosus]|nr:5-hydroxytryptamine receptor 1F-like [Scleropages formosus]XP_018584793.2 5-hydroxytryptamine receptor 1F-like [Scleropages formosus]